MSLKNCGVLVILGLICLTGYGQNATDTIKDWNLYKPQSQLVQDTIDARLQFVQDSIQAREQFVQDSIQRRKQILDSVSFLQGELQPILEAIHLTIKEDIISHADKIDIIGDSALGDYVYHTLPFSLSEPFTPWKGSLSLNAKNFRFTIDKKSNKISAIQSPSIKCSFNYNSQEMLLIIQEAYVIKNSYLGNFFMTPIDSVYYDGNNRIVKIKRYMVLYKLINTNQKGEFLFTNILQVKQYQYGINNQISQYELVKFCDRYKVYEPNKVCYIIKYTISKQNNNYSVVRSTNPVNASSDGTYKLEFDGNENVTSISFKNIANSQNWQRLVKVNKVGNVDCYMDKIEGLVNNSLCFVYHNEPNAKYPVETISTMYEKDGISYFQQNLTTQKARARDRLTLEWGPWK